MIDMPCGLTWFGVNYICLILLQSSNQKHQTCSCNVDVTQVLIEVFFLSVAATSSQNRSTTPMLFLYHSFPVISPAFQWPQSDIIVVRFVVLLVGMFSSVWNMCVIGQSMVHGWYQNLHLTAIDRVAQLLANYMDCDTIQQQGPPVLMSQRRHPRPIQVKRTSQSRECLTEIATIWEGNYIVVDQQPLLFILIAQYVIGFGGRAF